ncbi:MAG TPA: ferredoxin [Frankiaceae bacterium]|nr:ferredoxin [Frankiaceae bacterium]
MSPRSDGHLTIHIDLARCRGHGICALLLADHVDLDDWGYAVLNEESADSRRATRRARRASRACPQGAISVGPVSNEPGRLEA